jgi:hypothetical protein
MNEFDVIAPWKGDYEVLEPKNWIGREFTHKPRFVEWLGIDFYPESFTGLVAKVNVELVEDDLGQMYVAAEGTLTDIIKRRPAWWKLLAWWGIVTPIGWFSEAMHNMMQMTFNSR